MTCKCPLSSLGPRSPAFSKSRASFRRSLLSQLQKGRRRSEHVQGAFPLGRRFPGAGKTTTIARLAKAYRQQGRNVGIVTNDQATDLVDTHALRAEGFAVGEVAGSCFCCNFNGLAGAVAQLELHQRPDVILAEPVGSCTDIVATVVQPLRRLYQDKFAVAPYGVILKPSHGRKILTNATARRFLAAGGVHLQEAAGGSGLRDPQSHRRTAAARSGRAGRPDRRRVSGRSRGPHVGQDGRGLRALLEVVDQQGNFGRRILDLDYDVYAAGEAELGWLNSSLRVTAAAPSRSTTCP